MILDDSRFVHIKIKDPIEKMLSDDEWGKTLVRVKIFYDKFFDSGRYKPKLTKFELTSTIYMLPRRVYFRIGEFSKYYKPNRDYTYSDYDPTFNVYESSLYHERLHQEYIDKILDDEKEKFLDGIEKISGSSENDLDTKMKNYEIEIENKFTGINKKDNFVDTRPVDLAKHKEIELKEWFKMHDLYVEWRKQI
jgi:hypothetical protein